MVYFNFLLFLARCWYYDSIGRCTWLLWRLSLSMERDLVWGQNCKLVAWWCSVHFSCSRLIWWWWTGKAQQLGWSSCEVAGRVPEADSAETVDRSLDLACSRVLGWRLFSSRCFSFVKTGVPSVSVCCTQKLYMLSIKAGLFCFKKKTACGAETRPFMK